MSGIFPDRSVTLRLFKHFMKAYSERNSKLLYNVSIYTEDIPLHLTFLGK